MKNLLVAALLLAPALARADEGMWTFDRFPSAQVEARYGFAPDAAWLEHVRRASARTSDCSASFVSPNGLVVTNHHCARECAEQLSTAAHNHVADGFYAREAKDEPRCPDEHIDQLVEITNVTERIGRATQGKTGGDLAAALRAEIGAVEKACQVDAKTRCQVVTLYRGGLHHLYRYRRWNDVRLVFVPEEAIAFFGGDLDNYEYPRWNYDVSFFRAYEDGKPAATPDYFRWSKGGAKEGDLIFMSGNPARTGRLLTVAQLRYQRDVVIPEWALRLAEQRGFLTGFAARGAEQARISLGKLLVVENNFKRARGQGRALADPAFMAAREAAEKELRARVAADPSAQGRFGAAWDDIDKATAGYVAFRSEMRYLEDSRELADPIDEAPWGFDSRLFVAARVLVRARVERALPAAQRLREFQDASLPALAQKLTSTAPIYPELEIATLAWSLAKMREELRPDHPVVRLLLARETPEELAARVVHGTRLVDAAERKRLWEDERALAQAAASDPMLLLAAAVDDAARAVRKKYEAVDATLQKGGELIAQARFLAFGTSVYPDATFTPRLSYGAVRGYELPGRKVPWRTEVAGLWERATGRPPFALPASWLAARRKLPADLPFNFVGTPDSVGGNSGSPILDRTGAIVGLNFDQNIEGTATPLGYDERRRRAVFVHSELILRALEAVYGATRLVSEIRPAK
ncbi:MAG TPA: S46 family peptidase [Haliangiales bacterium]|nr:S46 family peptidase [Haliangiales bacterium]